MQGALQFLARRRWAGVGLALLAETVILAALALLSATDTVGVPGAVAAAIAGTVAVVFGVADGVAVAAVGALVFASLDGWHAGGIAAVLVWPPVVAAAGVFARRVDRHRAALRVLVAEQEDERRTLASTLHDDSAQALSGALMTLRAGLESGPERAREQINETIKQLRRLAVDLSPKALEDYGLSAALAHLAEAESATFEPRWEGRLPESDERMLFRFAQTALRTVRERGAGAAALELGQDRGRVVVTVRAPGAAPAGDLLPASLEERIRLLDGRVATRLEDDELVLTADVPLA
jgi:signal transduction histidine kinase